MLIAVVIRSKQRGATTSRPSVVSSGPCKSTCDNNVSTDLSNANEWGSVCLMNGTPFDVAIFVGPLMMIDYAPSTLAPHGVHDGSGQVGCRTLPGGRNTPIEKCVT